MVWCVAAVQFGIALPAWIVEKKTSFWVLVLGLRVNGGWDCVGFVQVLVLYVVAIVIVLPAVVVSAT